MIIITSCTTDIICSSRKKLRNTQGLNIYITYAYFTSSLYCMIAVYSRTACAAVYACQVSASLCRALTFMCVCLCMFVCMQPAAEASSTVSHGGASGAEHWTLTDTSVLCWPLPTAPLSGAQSMKDLPQSQGLICWSARATVAHRCFPFSSFCSL